MDSQKIIQMAVAIREAASRKMCIRDSAEYRAKLNNAVYELGGDLSYESVKAVSEELNTIAQEQLNTTEQQHLEASFLIELKYKTDGNYEEYTAAIEDELKTYFANQAQVSATAFEPLIGKFNAAFSDALTEAQPAFDRPVEDLLDRTFHQFTTDETGVLVGDSISDFMRSVDPVSYTHLDVYKRQIQGYSPLRVVDR